MATSNYAVSLPGMPDKLRALSLRLKIDSVIQRDLKGIIDEAVACAGTFCKSFKENSEELHIQNELVKQAENPADVNVNALQKVLTKTKTSFSTSQVDIIQLQTKVHAQIENCRGQVKKHKEEKTTKKALVANKKSEIRRLEETIDEYEKDAEDFDKGARELDDRADGLEELQEKKAKRGLIGHLVSAGVGLVLAPLTGGLSLLAGTAVGAIIAGVNLHDANECRKSANSCRDSAYNKRKRAKNLRTDVRKLENTVDTLETEISKLKKRIRVLKDAIQALADVTSFLRSSIGVSDEVIDAIQNMDSTLRDTLLKEKTFSSVRDRGRGQMATKLMQKLRDSLEQVLCVMIRNKRYALKN